MKRIALMICGAAFASSAAAAGWPALPKDGFVAGRASTPADVKAGRAICTYLDIYMDDGGEPEAGRPLENFPVPQYAWAIDDPYAENPNREPVIIIQAEIWGDGVGLGYGIRHFDGRAECLDEFHVEPLGADPAKLPKLK